MLKLCVTAPKPYVSLHVTAIYDDGTEKEFWSNDLMSWMLDETNGQTFYFQFDYTDNSIHCVTCHADKENRHLVIESDVIMKDNQIIKDLLDK